MSTGPWPRYRVHEAAVVYFNAVWRAGSIRTAARQLNVASTAVNRQILKLEETLGVALFERVPKGIKLTAAGESFARHATIVLQDFDRVISDIEALKGIRGGHVEIVTTEGLCTDLLPCVLELARQRYPEVTFGIQVRSVPDIPVLVCNGDAHIGLTFDLARRSDLRQVTVRRFRVGAVVKGGSELAGRRSVTLRDCADYPLILARQNFAMRQQIEPGLLALGLGHRQSIEAESLELMKRSVLRGLGIGFQTRIGLERELESGALVHIPLNLDNSLFQDLGTYVKPGSGLSPAVDAFSRLLVDEIALREAIDQH